MILGVDSQDLAQIQPYHTSFPHTCRITHMKFLSLKIIYLCERLPQFREWVCVRIAPDFAADRTKTKV
jgi:hypothetical protein